MVSCSTKNKVMKNVENEVSEQIRNQLMSPMSNKVSSPVRFKVWNQISVFMHIEIKEGLVSQVIRNIKL
jgi:hypothetical protein